MEPHIGPQEMVRCLLWVILEHTSVTGTHPLRQNWGDAFHSHQGTVLSQSCLVERFCQGCLGILHVNVLQNT